MALTQVNRGTTPNDNSADTLYVAFGKVNSNATSLDTTITTSSDSIFNGVKVGRGVGNVPTNLVVGIQALNSNTTGDNNTSIGTNTLRDNSDGFSNTVIGAYAMERNTTGDGNTAVGGGALYSAVLINNNTAIGRDALNGNTLYSNCSGLGANTVVTASNQVQLGDSATTTYVYGTVQNRSDLRDKTEVRNTVLGLDFINELRPVDYKWDMREDYKTEKPNELALDATDEEKEAYKILMDAWLESVKLDNITHDGTHTRNRYHHGLIAQEVQDVIEASGVDFGGFQDHSVSGGQDVLSIGYNELIAPMIKAIQELTARINVLENN